MERWRDRVLDSDPVSLHRLISAVCSPIVHAAPVFLPALVLLIGAVLRLSLLGRDVRFHPDEALFAAQARLINTQGDLLLRTTDLDKPPLTFYVSALSFRLLGTSEFSARLPNILFSMLSSAALYALALAIYQSRKIAVLAALLMALSPYDLAFSATLFTDIQATFWVLLACWLAAQDRWGTAGVACVLAFASKSTALAFLPLIVALGLVSTARVDWKWRDIVIRLFRFLVPFAVGVVLVFLWDLGRAPRSFWTLGTARNNPGRWIRSEEVWPRLEAWVHWLNTSTGVPLLNAALLAGVVILLGYGLRRRSRAAAADWSIAGFGLAFLALYWLVAFNTYDRYLHTLIPFLILLAARVLSGLRRITLPVVLACLLLIVPQTAKVLEGRAAVGGDQGQHDGINQVAGYLNHELAGETVYDHWLGWELAYYLGPRPHVMLAYTALPEALADEISHQHETRYFVAPSAGDAAPWLALLRRAGVKISIIYHDPDHPPIIYQLEPEDHGGNNNPHHFWRFW